MDVALSRQRVLVTGAAGQLGGFLLPALVRAGAIPIGLGGRWGVGVDLVADVADQVRTRAAIESARPDAIIHAAAWTDVDGCERDPTRAEAVNATGTTHVALAARDVGAYLVTVSTDFVFPGDGGAPYAEDAPPRPFSVYGQTKLLGEQGTLKTDGSFAVARTAWLYGGSGKHFPRTVLTVLRDRGTMAVVSDEVGNPTYAGDLAEALVALVAARGAGIFHLTNRGSASRFDLARAVAAAAGIDPSLVTPTTTATFLERFPLPARRPADSRLINVRATALDINLRPWQEAVIDHLPRLASELGVAPTGSMSEVSFTAGGVTSP
jgi:dTDP-4-dehydrorhamnose reductase